MEDVEIESQLQDVWTNIILTKVSIAAIRKCELAIYCKKMEQTLQRAWFMQQKRLKSMSLAVLSNDAR